MDVIRRLKAGLEEDPALSLMEYRGRDFSRGEVSAFGSRALELLAAAGAPKDAKVGVVVRNRILHAAVMLGLLARGRGFTSLYAMQSPEALALEIGRSGFAAVVADDQDWSAPLLAAVQRAGALGVRLVHAEGGPAVEPVVEAARLGPGPFARYDGEPGVEILSSGTTGAPKRILFPFRMLSRAVESVTAGRLPGPPEPEVLAWPYSGIGGMCNLVAGAVLGRHTTLLDKFNVAEWVDAVRRRRPRFVSGPPAVARMVLDAGVPPEDLSSIEYFYGGGAPMPPELQDAFEAAYDLQVIWAYGATEFCGTVVSWTPELRARFGAAKRGAMGRALPGVDIRVVDQATGEPLALGEVGFLEAKVAIVSDDWVRTTDLGLVDEDGFVFHRGRGDGAILRGGFKVLPEAIVAALASHPAVLDAAAVGAPDHRLGQVPVAAVELRAGAEPVSEAELIEHARRELVSHHVPTRILVLDALPRTTSLKVDLAAICRRFETKETARDPRV